MRVLTQLLANMASEHVQTKYMVSGTRDEYLVPSELLEDAYYAMRLVKENRPGTKTLTASARASIMALAPLLEEAKNLRLVETASPKQLISHPAWMAIREQAAKCLRELNFDREAWEAQQ